MKTKNTHPILPSQFKSTSRKTQCTFLNGPQNGRTIRLPVKNYSDQITCHSEYQKQFVSYRCIKVNKKALTATYEYAGTTINWPFDAHEDELQQLAKGIRDKIDL